MGTLAQSAGACAQPCSSIGTYHWQHIYAPYPIQLPGTQPGSSQDIVLSAQWQRHVFRCLSCKPIHTPVHDAGMQNTLVFSHLVKPAACCRLWPQLLPCLTSSSQTSFIAHSLQSEARM
jgi:hypothetical protein